MQKRQNITLSLPQDLVYKLHIYVKKRGISEFVQEAIIEKLEAQSSSLEKQYMEAARDSSRNKVFNEWDSISGDGLSEQNEW